MSKRNYDVVAFGSFGEVIYSERVHTVASARRTAREFLPYVNVYTVDIIFNGRNVSRYVKLTPNTGVVITDGQAKNIRF